LIQFHLKFVKEEKIKFNRLHVKRVMYLSEKKLEVRCTATWEKSTIK